MGKETMNKVKTSAADALNDAILIDKKEDENLEVYLYLCTCIFTKVYVQNNVWSAVI